MVNIPEDFLKDLIKSGLPHFDSFIGAMNAEELELLIQEHPEILTDPKYQFASWKDSLQFKTAIDHLANSLKKDKLPPGQYEVRSFNDSYVVVQNVITKRDALVPRTMFREEVFSRKYPLKQFSIATETRAQFLERRRKTMSLIERLKNINIESATIDEMVEVSADARSVEAEYGQLKVSVPDALTSGVATLRKAIQFRIQDKMEKDLKSLKAQMEAMQTVQEKRDKIAAQVAALEAQLAGK